MLVSSCVLCLLGFRRNANFSEMCSDTVIVLLFHEMSSDSTAVFINCFVFEVFIMHSYL